MYITFAVQIRTVLKHIEMNREELFEKKPMIKINDKLFPCPTSAAMELIGGKWKSVILTHLIEGEKRYNELRKEMPTVYRTHFKFTVKNIGRRSKTTFDLPGSVSIHTGRRAGVFQPGR